MIGTVNDIVCLSGEAVVHIPLINLVLLTNKTVEVFTEGGIRGGYSISKTPWPRYF